MRLLVSVNLMLLLTACASTTDTPMQSSPPDVTRYGSMAVPVATVEVIDSRPRQTMPAWLRRDLYHDMLSAWAEHRFTPASEEHALRIEIKKGSLDVAPSVSTEYEQLSGHIELRLAFYNGDSVWPTHETTINTDAHLPYHVDADATMRDKAYNALLQRLMDMVDAEAEQRILSLIPAEHMPRNLDHVPPVTDPTAPEPLTRF